MTTGSMHRRAAAAFIIEFMKRGIQRISLPYVLHLRPLRHYFIKGHCSFLSLPYSNRFSTNFALMFYTKSGKLDCVIVNGVTFLFGRIILSHQEASMTVLDFLMTHRLCPSQIPEKSCLHTLLEEMEMGLTGIGRIPMLPSYLPASVTPPLEGSCCVLDAGGTNLRAAQAHFDRNGNCQIERLQVCPMPGTLFPMDKQTFYNTIAGQVRATGCTRKIGFCFSYNLILDRNLDGILQAWCKEVQVPEALWHPVGASLKAALGESCQSVHMLNDSVAAMLGASGRGLPVQVGIILGTGINVCYEERCSAIPKVARDLQGEHMIISTEVGEFDGIPKSDFDLALIASTEDSQLAHAEKQCAGGYLGELICQVWNGAAEEGLLPEEFLGLRCTLPQISGMLDGGYGPIPANENALLIAKTVIHRAAKIAAILCAGPVLRCTQPRSCINIAVEGSQFWKLSGFRTLFCQELEQLLHPYEIRYSIVHSENACLKGAALAAFAQPM